MLFADDLLLFLTSPLTSTPNVYKVLWGVGLVLGLKVKISKSVALNVSVPPEVVAQLKHNFAFTWATDSIPYLGISLSYNISKLFQANYPPMIRKCDEDLVGWSKYGLSWLSRINAVKMTLLP